MALCSPIVESETGLVVVIPVHANHSAPHNHTVAGVVVGVLAVRALLLHAVDTFSSIDMQMYLASRKDQVLITSFPKPKLGALENEIIREFTFANKEFVMQCVPREALYWQRGYV